MIWVVAYLFRDIHLRERARANLAGVDPGVADKPQDLVRLCQSLPILSSVYAETPRMHGSLYLLLTARGADVRLGSWLLP
jgi:hypothetical protein